jgi:hypothetical protein
MGPRSGPSPSLFSEHKVMDEIASDTGGHAFYFTNGLADAIATSTEDGTNYYTLSYSPTNTNFNGRLRKTHVKGAQPNYHLAYRRSYLADDENVVSQKVARAPEERLQNAAIRGAPLSHDLVFAAQIHPQGASEKVPDDLIPHLLKFPVFAGRKTWDDVQVQPYRVDYKFVGGRIFFQPAANGTHRGEFEFQFAVYDQDNRAMLGQWTRLDNAYSTKKFLDITQGTYALTQVIPIPAGAAWLRLVVRDVVGDQIGSLEIP